MNINLHIERLVLDGLPLTSGQSRTVQAALECELAALFEERGIKTISGGAVPHLSVAPIQLSPDGQPRQWGRQIARTIYDGLAPAAASADFRSSKQPLTPAAPRDREFKQNTVSQNHEHR